MLLVARHRDVHRLSRRALGSVAARRRVSRTLARQGRDRAAARSRSMAVIVAPTSFRRSCWWWARRRPRRSPTTRSRSGASARRESTRRTRAACVERSADRGCRALERRERRTCAHQQRNTASLPRLQPEVRADFIGARAAAAHLGVGLSVPASTYVRLGIVARRDRRGRTATRRPPAASMDSCGSSSIRSASLAGHPTRQAASARSTTATRSGAAVLVGALASKGPARGRVVPAIEVGFGGGVRIGVGASTSDARPSLIGERGQPHPRRASAADDS